MLIRDLVSTLTGLHRSSCLTEMPVCLRVCVCVCEHVCVGVQKRLPDARRKRKDLDEIAKSLDCLRHTRCDHGVAKFPPGSRPGSSRDGQPPPPNEKSPYEKELDRIEELLDQMLLIRERRETTTERGVPTLDIKEYHYTHTSAMAHRYRELIPRIMIPFEQRRALDLEYQ